MIHVKPTRLASTRRPRRATLALLLGAVCACARQGSAGDWPQILGPNRDGAAQDESIVDSWPAEGPKTIWERTVGRGYAGLAIAGETAVLFHRVENEEVVEAMNAANGNVRWRYKTPTTYQSRISPDDGPRCVPVIHGSRVIVFGAQGNLTCLGLADGRMQWTRSTQEDYRTIEGYFGAGSSPLIVDDRVIVNVGGARSGAGVVAFALSDGKTLWTATREDASYSSPVAVTIAGTRHVIVETRLTTFSLDPQSGAVRFQLPFGKRGPTVNGANPTIFDDRLFLTASYGVGAVFAQIRDAAVEPLWTSDEVLSSQYTTCVRDGQVLFGIHGRDDVGPADLRCIDPKRQRVLWEKNEFGYATLVKADGKLIAQKTDGTLVLIRVDHEKYVELAAAKLFPTKTFALPALSAGRLFARDERTLRCLDVKR